MSKRTLNAILTHQPDVAVQVMEAWWKREMPDCETLIVFGGARDAFDTLGVAPKAFVEGDGHRTTDHQRQRQSYAGVLTAIAEWLGGKEYEFVNLLEFDVLPLSPSWVDDLEALSESEGAGLLAHRLQRIDGTGHAHYLNHAHSEEFDRRWRELSVRNDPGTILSMIGCHSFWRRDAFEAVAAQPEPFPTYLELHLPTLAHHLGFRVRRIPGDDEHMRPSPNFDSSEVERARSRGVAAVHPVKDLWQ